MLVGGMVDGRDERLPGTEQMVSAAECLYADIVPDPGLPAAEGRAAGHTGLVAGTGRWNAARQRPGRSDVLKGGADRPAAAAGTADRGGAGKARAVLQEASAE